LTATRSSQDARTKGAELIFVGASEDPQQELGIEFKPDRGNEHNADVFRDLKLPRKLPVSRYSKGDERSICWNARD
jgi:hypothetical protein